MLQSILVYVITMIATISGEYFSYDHCGHYGVQNSAKVHMPKFSYFLSLSKCLKNLGHIFAYDLLLF